MILLGIKAAPMPILTLLISKGEGQKAGAFWPLCYLVSATIPSVRPARAAAPPAIAPAVSQLSCVVPFMQVLV